VSEARGPSDELEPEPEPELTMEDLYDEMTLRRLGLWDDLGSSASSASSSTSPSTGASGVSPVPSRRVAGPVDSDDDGAAIVGTAVDGTPLDGTAVDGTAVGGSVAGASVVAGWVDRSVGGPEPLPPRRSLRRGLAGAMVAGAMLGLGEVLEPPPREAVVEPELLGEPPLDQPVQFIMMPGLPRASRVIIRPWLRAPRPAHETGPTDQNTALTRVNAG
jgi:hypothetical protein